LFPTLPKGATLGLLLGASVVEILCLRFRGRNKFRLQFEFHPQVIRFENYALKERKDAENAGNLYRYRRNGRRGGG
jgi:hypothetical protein